MDKKYIKIISIIFLMVILILGSGTNSYVEASNSKRPNSGNWEQINKNDRREHKQ